MDTGTETLMKILQGALTGSTELGLRPRAVCCVEKEAEVLLPVLSVLMVVA